MHKFVKKGDSSRSKDNKKEVSQKDEDHIPLRPHSAIGDKDDHKRTVNRGIVQVPWEVIPEASEQRSWDVAPKAKANGPRYSLLGRRCQRSETAL